jgi:hypothetical protein
MSTNIRAWYRGAAIGDSDERLSQRRSAAAELASQLEGTAAKEVAKTVAFGLGILTGSAGSSEASETVIEIMQNSQPSLDPEDPATLGDARLCTLASIETLIAERSARAARLARREPAVVAGEAIVAALRFRQAAVGEKLAEQLSTLAATAEALLDKLDLGRRTRRTELKPPLTRLRSAADVTAIRDEAVRAMENIWNDSLLDREELQALWWAFGGFSPTLSASYSSMTPLRAALAAGVDLASLIQWPGTRAFSELATRPSGLRLAEVALGDGANGNVLDASSAADFDALIGAAREGYEDQLAILMPLTASAIERAAGGDGKAPLAGLKADISLRDLARQAFAEASLWKVLSG